LLGIFANQSVGGAVTHGMRSDGKANSAGVIPVENLNRSKRCSETVSTTPQTLANTPADGADFL
jgi:hypothetical protein